jgi:large subunit ribosomal protein L21
MQYAVFRTGGKQYRASPGARLRVERLPAEVGAEIELGEVLLVGEGDAVRIGTPVLAGASVKARVLAHGRGEKIRIFKLKRRKRYRRTKGHRQDYTEIEILGIAQ